jgi:hypothetical protein
MVSRMTLGRRRGNWNLLLAVVGAASMLTLGSPALAAVAAPAQLRSAGMTDAVSAAIPLWPDLSGVWCANRHQCLAVGTDQQANPISAEWNGTSWRYLSTPASGHSLTALACSAWTSCLAVGASGVADQWNGRSWRALSSPVGTGLLSIACPSRKLCLAVGTTDYQKGKSGAISWNGSSWRTSTVPKPAGSVAGEFDSVACASAASCLAVGRYHSATKRGIPMAAAWNGTSWRLVKAPDLQVHAIACPSAANCLGIANGWSLHWNGKSWTQDRLGGIVSPLGLSCSSADFCIVNNFSFTDAWNGKAWRRIAPAQNGTRAVWCGSATDCMAVGGGDPQGDTSQWNGKSWKPIRVNKVDSLSTVSCSGPANCVALGDTNSSSELAGTMLAERWQNGSWQEITGPTLTGIDGIVPISCTGAKSCMAVGSVPGGHPAAEQWTGSTWKQAALPRLPGALSSVSCASSGSCVAVGFNSAVAWNGKKWQLTSAGIAGQTVGLQTVSCTGTICMAFGYHLASNCQDDCTISELAEYWNGSTWSVSDDASAGNTNQVELPVPAISCPSTTFCMVASGTTIATWSDGSWHQAAGSLAHDGDELSCSTVSYCVATGIYRIGTNPANHNFASAWTGAGWTATDPTIAGSGIEGVSCAGSADQCLAVGSTDDFLTMAQQWNGTNWTALTTINP